MLLENKNVIRIDNTNFEIAYKNMLSILTD